MSDYRYAAAERRADRLLEAKDAAERERDEARTEARKYRALHELESRLRTDTRRQRDEALAREAELREALGALGVIGDGYCFCSRDRDPDKAEHEPECRDARRALASGEDDQ